MRLLTLLLYVIRLKDLNRVQYDDGTKVQRRVILQNLANGFIVSSIPNSSLDLIEIFSNNLTQKHVISIQFVGQGLTLFSNIASVDFYTVERPRQDKL